MYHFDISLDVCNFTSKIEKPFLRQNNQPIPQIKCSYQYQLNNNINYVGNIDDNKLGIFRSLCGTTGDRVMRQT